MFWIDVVVSLYCKLTTSRMCADNKIVNYANNTFYPIRVAAVEVGTDTVQRSLYNPLCPCAGYSNSILFEPTTTPAA